MTRNVFDLKGRILRETDNAILVRTDQLAEHAPGEVWIPLSQVEAIHHAAPGTHEEDWLVITYWIAQQKGLV